MESRVEASLHSSTTDLVYNEEEALLISSAKKSAAGAPKTCGHCGLPGHNQTKCFEQHSHGQGCVLPKDLIPGDYHFYKCRDNIPTSIPRAVLQPARPVDLKPKSSQSDYSKMFYVQEENKKEGEKGKSLADKKSDKQEFADAIAEILSSSQETTNRQKHLQ